MTVRVMIRHDAIPIVRLVQRRVCPAATAAPCVATGRRSPDNDQTEGMRSVTLL
jgi:hypothetical protein